MTSSRFLCAIHVTRHARLRMFERNMDDALLLDLIDTGTVKNPDLAVGDSPPPVRGAFGSV